MDEHVIWEEYLLSLGVEAKIKQLQDEGCPEDTARTMVEQDAKDYRETMRKQHAPMTEAQGERIIELLERAEQRHARSEVVELERLELEKAFPRKRSRLFGG